MLKRMKLLIGYDGSNHSNAAIDDLRRAGLPSELEAVVVSVGSDPLVQPLSAPLNSEKARAEKAISIAEHARRQISTALTEANELLNEARKRLKSYFPAWHLSGEVLSGTPAPELIQKAGALKSDLIVVGSQGRSAIGRFILGSVSMEVASEALCSVRIGRRSINTERAALRILVGLDGSPEAERAIRKVLVRPWPAGTELRVVAVDDGLSAVKVAALSKDATANRIIKLAEKEGLSVSAGIKEGDPETVLIAEAGEWEADCIVIGSRGSGNKTEGFFATSVLSGLVGNAECSIEILR